VDGGTESWRERENRFKVETDLQVSGGPDRFETSWVPVPIQRRLTHYTNLRRRSQQPAGCNSWVTWTVWDHARCRLPDLSHISNERSGRPSGRRPADGLGAEPPIGSM